MASKLYLNSIDSFQSQPNNNRRSKPRKAKKRKRRRIGPDWSCAICTFLNPGRNSRCELCLTVRPKPELPPVQSIKLSTSTSYDKFQHNHFNNHHPSKSESDKSKFRRPPAFEFSYNQSSSSNSSTDDLFGVGAINELVEHKEASPLNHRHHRNDKLFKKQISTFEEKDNALMNDLFSEMESSSNQSSKNSKNKKLSVKSPKARRSLSKGSLTFASGKINQKRQVKHRKASSLLQRSPKMKRSDSFNNNDKKKELNTFSSDIFAFNLKPKPSNLMKRKSADFTNHKIKKQRSAPKIAISCPKNNEQRSHRSGIIMVTQSMTSPLHHDCADSEVPKFENEQSTDALYVPPSRRGTHFKKKNYTLPPPAPKFEVKKKKKKRNGHHSSNFSLTNSIFGANVYSELRMFLQNNDSDDSKQNEENVALAMKEQSIQKHESILLEILKDTNQNEVISAITLARCDVLCHFLPLIAFILCSSDKREWRTKLLSRLKQRIVGQSDLRQSVKFFVECYRDVKSVQAVFAGLIADGKVRNPHSSEDNKKDVIEFWQSLQEQKEGDSLRIPQNCIYRDPLRQLTSPIRRVVIRKVINSNAKPLLVDVYGADKTMSEFLSSQFILKAGDDLRKDKACMLVFKWMNHLWKNKCDFRHRNKCIRIETYRVVPLTNELGCIELVRNCLPLRDVAQLQMKNSDHMTNLITSAAGSYIGSYIMGVRDRHFDNILIRQTDFTLFHIDFNYCLGEKVFGLDANQFGVTKELYDLFGQANYLIFIGAAAKAFLELRHCADELINFACLAFSYIHDHKYIGDYIRKQLRMREDDATAMKWLTKELENAPSDKQTLLKNIIHGFATK